MINRVINAIKKTNHSTALIATNNCVFGRMYVQSAPVDEVSQWIFTFLSHPVWFVDTCHTSIVGTSQCSVSNAQV